MFKAKLMPAYLTAAISSLISFHAHASLNLMSADCRRLDDLKSTYTLTTELRDKESSYLDYFGLPLKDWNDDDFKLAGDFLILCNKEFDHIFSFHNPDFFYSEVERVVVPMMREQKNNSDSLERSRKAAVMLNKELDSLTDKVKEMAITEAELQRINEIYDISNDHYKNGDPYSKDLNEVSKTASSLLNLHARNKSDIELVKWANEGKERIKMEMEADLAKQSDESLQLVKEIGAIGPATDFLRSQFQTYLGSSVSGNMGTVIKLYSQVGGDKKWKKRDDMWVLFNDTKDPITGKKISIAYGFYDLRDSRGHIWLERIVINGEDYPHNNMFYFVSKIMKR